ncbi:MAG: hypothetical protein WBP74_07385 [Nitrososphaeraceae archaeon]
MKIGHIFDGKISFILTFSLHLTFSWSFSLLYRSCTGLYRQICIARVLVYPSVWKENGVVAPIIEVKVLNQVREESHLDVAEVDEKYALDTETSIYDIELPKKQGNVGEEVDVCISLSEKYTYPC